MRLVDTLRIDNSVLEDVSLDDHGDDREYWKTKTPVERLQALEILRQIVYGYDPLTDRIPRVLTNIEQPWG